MDVPPVHLDVWPALPPPLAQLEGCGAHEAAGVLEQGAAVEVHQSLHAVAGGGDGRCPAPVLSGRTLAADVRSQAVGLVNTPRHLVHGDTGGDLNTVEWRQIIQYYMIRPPSTVQKKTSIIFRYIMLDV